MDPFADNPTIILTSCHFKIEWLTQNLSPEITPITVLNILAMTSKLISIPFMDSHLTISRNTINDRFLSFKFA